MTTATIGDNTGNTYSGTDDGQIKQAAATTNYGSSTTMEVHKYGSGDHCNSLVKFSGLSNIAGPVTVSSATIYLYLTNNANTAGSVTIDCYRLLRNWVEAQATWNIYSTGNSWTTAGGLSSGNDIAASITASKSITNGALDTGVYHAFTSAQLATDVQDIINGSASNYGWHFSRNGAGNDSMFHTFNTSENASDNTRPYLEVVYTASATAKPAFYYAQL